ncbi:hypothetical protein BD779DRAFT_337144 [Infundibulicybe gibba]|nr:hypothetical protein BD779DRAFT_337144 [Infundibulicybe gibba]
MGSHPTLFDLLQSEFCPPAGPLDSALLATLLNDIELDSKGHSVSPSTQQIDALRSNLRELSAGAEQVQHYETADCCLNSPTDETGSTLESYYGNATATTFTSRSSSSTSSTSSCHSFSSPLGFLQTAFPYISTAALEASLGQTEADGVDLWDVVAGILSEESIRELEERGLDGYAEEGTNRVVGDEEIVWETVKRKPKKTKETGKRKPRPGPTLTLGDVRQKQQLRPVVNKNKNNGLHVLPAPDLWTQVSSLSTYLATLIPEHRATFFQSYFHSAEYSTPYQALRSALKSICKARPSSTSHTPALFGLLEMLLPEYESLDPEQRDCLISDIELSLVVTAGRENDALDLIKLLRELDSDSKQNLEMGVYHLPPQSPVSPIKEAPSLISRLPTGPPPVQPPQSPREREKPPNLAKPSPYQWQTIPQRRTTDNGPHPLAEYIPAYAQATKGQNIKGSGNSFGKGGKGDVGELNKEKLIKKRDEMLREATRMWKMGNARMCGGEVALYFTEKARQYQELIKAESLNIARRKVHEKRMASGKKDTIDFHGTNVAEAITIVKEILRERTPTQAQPLKIITGRGNHSAKQISVLKPAIKNALSQDGWSVGTWTGGLTVDGKRRT